MLSIIARRRETTLLHTDSITCCFHCLQFLLLAVYRACRFFYLPFPPRVLLPTDSSTCRFWYAILLNLPLLTDSTLATYTCCFQYLQIPNRQSYFLFPLLADSGDSISSTYHRLESMSPPSLTIHSTRAHILILSLTFNML